MKLSKKWKYSLFSFLGIVSISIAAVATMIIVLKQDNNNAVTSNVIDASTSNKLANFSTKWETKTKEEQEVANQFNQFLNYDGGNESSNTKDVTLLISNENSIKNKELMTKIANGLKNLSTKQQNQIKNGMLAMRQLTKNNPITDKNIDSIYGHFISQDKINQIKANDNSRNINQGQNISLFDNIQNPTVSQTLDNLETVDIAFGGVAVIAATISVLMWFFDWFGITTSAAISASCVAAALGIIAVGLGIKIALIKAYTEGYANESFLAIAHYSLMAAPLVSARADIVLILVGLTAVTDSFGWIVPVLFTLTGIASWVISICMMVKND